MTTTTTATRPVGSPAASTDAGRGVTFPRLLRSEQIKLWSVRSTPWVLGITALVIVGITALFSAVATSNTDPGPDAHTVGVQVLGPATQMAQLALAVIGVLTITGEYSTGMIRSSLTAAPRRTPVIWSKLVVLFLTVLVTAAVAVAVAIGIQALIVNGRGFSLDFGDAEVQRLLVGTVLYLATIGAFAFALGALLRHSAAALATVLGLLVVVENLFFIPWKPLSYIHPFLPSTAGLKLTYSDADIASLNDQMRGPDFTAWQGYGILVAWVVVLLACALWRLKKRDA
jgi:ABC-2 type transport system permease protein